MIYQEGKGGQQAMIQFELILLLETSSYLTQREVVKTLTRLQMNRAAKNNATPDAADATANECC